MMERITYWLIYRGEPIYPVRAELGATDSQIRMKALEEHDRVPFHLSNMGPSLRDIAHHCSVRTYADGA